jgi:hypothetical protein
MTSEELRQLIPEYLAGRLGEAEKRQFEAQLSGNAELLMHVEELRATWQDMGRLPMQVPSAALRARFYRRLHDIETGREPVPRGAFMWWKPGLSGLVRQVTIVLALFCLGMYVGRVSVGFGKQSNEETARLQAQVESLRQTVALSLLGRQSPASRLEGVTWSSQVQRPDRDLLSALISTLQTDPNTNVRLAALDALEKFSADPQVRQALINAVGHEDSPLVQIALIDSLVRLRDQKAAGELQKLSTETDANAAVRQRAQWALKTLSF